MEYDGLFSITYVAFEGCALFAACCIVAACLAYFSNLKMEAIC